MFDGRMKGKKSIIRSKQRKSERNSDDEKLDQICMALAELHFPFKRNVFLVFCNRCGRVREQDMAVRKIYLDKKHYQINNCDIVVQVAGQDVYIELDGEAIHGICDSESSIEAKTRERNRRYTRAGLLWFTINETLAKFTGFKNCFGDLSAFIVLSFIQKIVAIGDIKKDERENR